MAAPGLTIGYTHSSLATWKSITTGPLWASAFLISGLDFLGSLPLALDSVSLGDFHEIGGIGHVSMGITSVIKEFLPLTNHPQ